MPLSPLGENVPDIALASTTGNTVNLSKLPGTTVLFCYPYTGRPGVPDPEGWDHIKGAHGSTPQALAFSKAWPEFEKLGVKVFGVSFQATAWQQEFVSRNGIPFPLLSDEGRRFASAMKLETFKAGTEDFLKRRTFVIRDGVITHNFNAITDPAGNAADVLDTLRT